MNNYCCSLLAFAFIKNAMPDIKQVAHFKFSSFSSFSLTKNRPNKKTINNCVKADVSESDLKNIYDLSL